MTSLLERIVTNLFVCLQLPTMRTAFSRIALIKCLVRFQVAGTSRDSKKSYTNNPNYGQNGWILPEDVLQQQDEDAEQLRNEIAFIHYLFRDQCPNKQDMPNAVYSEFMRMVRGLPVINAKARRRLYDNDHQRHDATVQAIDGLLRAHLSGVKTKNGLKFAGGDLDFPSSIPLNVKVRVHVVLPENHRHEDLVSVSPCFKNV